MGKKKGSGVKRTATVPSNARNGGGLLAAFGFGFGGPKDPKIKRS